jgi:hypothetical protein
MDTLAVRSIVLLTLSQIDTGWLFGVIGPELTVADKSPLERSVAQLSEALDLTEAARREARRCFDASPSGTSP